MAFENVQSTDDLSVPDFGELDDQIRASLRSSHIGGGEGYIGSLSDGNIRTRDDADVVVASIDELVSASNNSSVDSIFVESGFDLAGHTIDLRDTDLFSDRGVNGSGGALLYTSEKGHHTHAWSAGSGIGQIQLRGDSALFGLRIRGDCLDWDASGHRGYVPYPDGDRSERDEVYQANRGRAVKIHDDEGVVANCRIWGWGASGIAVSSTNRSPADCHIHHVDITDCMMTSAGYAIDIFRGLVTIEDSYFNATRHSVATFGYYDSGWQVRNCLFGPSHSSHILDAHGLHNNISNTSDNPQNPDWTYRASGRMVCEDCTFLVDHVIPDANFDRGNPTWAISIRGVPWPMDGEGISVDRCEFVHDGPQSKNHGIRSFGNPAAMNQGPVPTQFQNDMGFSENFVIGNNRYNISLFPEFDSRYGIDTDLRDPSAISYDEARMARNDPHAKERGEAMRGIEDGLEEL